jgi:hypothetical protein
MRATIAIKKAREYGKAKAFKDYFVEYGPIAHCHTDEEIETLVQAGSSAFLTFHLSGEKSYFISLSSRKLAPN